MKRRPLRSHIIVGSRSLANPISSFSHQLSQLIESPTTTELNRVNFGCFAFTDGEHSLLRIILKFLRIFITVRSQNDPGVRVNWPEEQSRMVPTRVVLKVHHQTPSGDSPACRLRELEIVPLPVAVVGNTGATSSNKRASSRITFRAERPPGSANSRMNLRHGQAIFSTVSTVTSTSVVSAIGRISILSSRHSDFQRS